jgi:hypothetical protein
MRLLPIIYYWTGTSGRDVRYLIGFIGATGGGLEGKKARRENKEWGAFRRRRQASRECSFGLLLFRRKAKPASLGDGVEAIPAAIPRHQSGDCGDMPEEDRPEDDPPRPTWQPVMRNP